MKVKKLISFIIMAVVFMSTINLSGCGFHSENQLKQTLENALEAKYDEEFVCLDVWGNGGSSYWGVCAPEKNHDIRFEALFGADGHIAEEGYYAACVAEKIEEDVQKELENVFNDFYLHSYMTVPLYSCENNDIYAENVKNESFDIDEYVSYVKEKREWRTSITLIILVNSEKPNKLSFEEEYDNLSDIMLHIEKLGIGTIVYLKIIPEKEYLDCIEYLETCANTNSTFKDMVRDFPVKVSDVDLNISFEGEDATYVLITQEEYIKQRKEVN